MESLSQRFSTSVFPFAAIVRTQGLRPELFSETLFSIATQAMKTAAIVVLHGKKEMLPVVQEACEKISGLDFALLWAGELEKKRGYPLNVGLEFFYQNKIDSAALFFLDDDDIVYPFFTTIMNHAFCLLGSEMVYSASNSRFPGHYPREGYIPKHPTELFLENFIPINSYAIKAEALREKPVFFDEDLSYLEDWHFLLQLLEKGFRFESVPDTLSEFRITSDGNISKKNHPELWKKSSLKIRKYINETRFQIGGDLLVKTDYSSAPPTVFCGDVDSGPRKKTTPINLFEVPARELFRVIGRKIAAKCERQFLQIRQKLFPGIPK